MPASLQSKPRGHSEHAIASTDDEALRLDTSTYRSLQEHSVTLTLPLLLRESEFGGQLMHAF